MPEIVPVPKFTRAAPASDKKDARGKVVVKVYLQNPLSLTDTASPVVGNRKEQIALDNATVGEVIDAINLALFGGGQCHTKDAVTGR